MSTDSGPADDPMGQGNDVLDRIAPQVADYLGELYTSIGEDLHRVASGAVAGLEEGQAGLMSPQTAAAIQAVAGIEHVAGQAMDHLSGQAGARLGELDHRIAGLGIPGAPPFKGIVEGTPAYPKGSPILGKLSLPTAPVLPEPVPPPAQGFAGGVSGAPAFPPGGQPTGFSFPPPQPGIPPICPWSQNPTVDSNWSGWTSIPPLPFDNPPWLCVSTAPGQNWPFQRYQVLPQGTTVQPNPQTGGYVFTGPNNQTCEIGCSDQYYLNGAWPSPVGMFPVIPQAWVPGDCGANKGTNAGQGGTTGSEGSSAGSACSPPANGSCPSPVVTCPAPVVQVSCPPAIPAGQATAGKFTLYSDGRWKYEFAPGQEPAELLAQLIPRALQIIARDYPTAEEYELGEIPDPTTEGPAEWSSQLPLV